LATRFEIEMSSRVRELDGGSLQRQFIDGRLLKTNTNHDSVKMQQRGSGVGRKEC
jgi:hypothetical protein